MKKKLALILSIVLAFSFAACAFVSASADDSTPYAQKKATELWEATKDEAKATKFRTSISGEYTSAASGNLSEIGFVNLNGTPAEGTFTFEKGILTLKGAGQTVNFDQTNAATATPQLSFDGATWLVLDNISIAGGRINNEHSFIEAGLNDPTVDLPLIISSPIDTATFEVKEDGVGGFIINKDPVVNNNMIRSHGSVIILGDVGFQYEDADSAIGDAICVRRTGCIKTLIIAPGRDSYIKVASTPSKTIRVEGAEGTDLYFTGDIFGKDVKVSIDNNIVMDTVGDIKVIEGADLTVNAFGNPSMQSGIITNGSMVISDDSKLTFNNPGSSWYSVQAKDVTVEDTASLIIKTKGAKLVDGTTNYTTSGVVYYEVLKDSTYTYTFPVAGKYMVGGSEFVANANDTKTSATEITSITKVADSSNTGSSNTGSSNTGSSNTGSSNTGSSNTGSNNTNKNPNTSDLEITSVAIVAIVAAAAAVSVIMIRKKVQED